MLKKMLCALLSTALLTISVGAEWSGFRTKDKAIIGAESAIESSDIVLRLSIAFDENDPLGMPAVYDGSIYITTGKTLKKLSKKTGEVEAEFVSEKSFQTNYAPIILDSTVTAAYDNGIVILDCMNLSVISTFEADGYEICTPLTVKDDIAYFGADKDDSGVYFAVRNGEELWRYESAESFNDCGAVVHKDRVVFCGSDGNSVSHSAEGSDYNLLALGGAVSSTPFADEYAVYVSTDNGYVCKFRLNDDGTFEDGAFTTCFIDETELSSPLVNMGRVYVGAAGKPFAVLDSLNMEVVYRIDGVNSLSAPVITLANGARVLVLSEKVPYYIYSIYDYETLTTAKYTPITQFNEYDGSMNTIVLDSDGIMYVKPEPHKLVLLAYKGLDYFVIAIKLLLVLVLFICFVLWLRILKKKSADKKSPFLRS